MLWLFFVADVILWMAGLGGHEESLTLAILLTIVLVIVGLIVMADHNYTPPKGHKTDWAAMHNDALNGVSKPDMMIRRISGYYDKPKDRDKK